MTSNELYKDPTADPEEGVSWWDKFKDVIMQAFAAAILVTSFVLSVILPTSSFGIGFMSATFTGGLISGIISGTTSAIMANNQGNRQVEIFADSFVSGFTHGVITSAIFYCVINIASGLMKLSNKSAPRGMTNSDMADDMLQFESRAKLEAHYAKHGKEFGNLYQSADDYLAGANYVVKNGSQVSYVYNGELRTGYVKFYGNSTKHYAKFAFVGTNNSGSLTSYHIKKQRIYGFCLEQRE